MLSSLFSFLNEICFFHGGLKTTITKFVICDNKDHEFDMKPLLEAEKCEKKAAVKVKILMTKEEANRLLSKCKDGGALECKDVARELVRLPINRVTVVSSGNQIDWLIKSIDKHH